MASPRDAASPATPLADRTAISLGALRYLVALAETCHFGRAAARCHVSQPALSEQVARLERVLGAPLVERGRSTRLTATGSEVVARARRILREVEELADAADAGRAPLSGSLRLGVIPTLGPYVLPTLLPAANAAFPRLRLALHEALTADLLREVAEHRLDLALLALPLSAPGLVTRALFHEPFVVLLPERHPLARRAELRVAELPVAETLLLTEGHCLREQALELCAMGSRSVDGNGAVAPDVRATSLETLARLVAAGMGITLLPALAAPTVGRGLVTRPLRAAGRTPPGRTIGLVWRKSHARPKDVVAFADLLREIGSRYA
jgi:LysR family hydrogen peroxide-inducible transcriptional activator